MSHLWTAKKLKKTKAKGSRDGYDITPYLWHAYADDPEKRALVLAHQYTSIPYYDSEGYWEEDNGCPTCGVTRDACQALQDLVEPFITEGMDEEVICCYRWRRSGLPVPPPYDGPWVSIENKIVYGQIPRGAILTDCIIRGGAGDFRVEEMGGYR